MMKNQITYVIVTVAIAAIVAGLSIIGLNQVASAQGPPSEFPGQGQGSGPPSEFPGNQDKEVDHHLNFQDKVMDHHF